MFTVASAWEPAQETSSKLSIGRSSYSERQKLRDEVLALETKRADSIVQNQGCGHERFMALMARFAADQAARDIERSERIKTEERERAAERLQAETESLQSERLRATLDTKRTARIAGKLERRAQSERARIHGIVADGVQRKSDWLTSCKTWRSERDARETTEDHSRIEAAKKAAILDGKRMNAFHAREARWKAREQEYLKHRAEQIHAKERKAVHLREKKQEQVHALFAPID